MRTSVSLSNIAKALVLLHEELKNPPNSAVNPFFKSKYAPLSEIINIARPILTKHGLSIVQSPSGSGETTSVTTMIIHTSGEWIESDPLVLKPDKMTPQGAGSAITYARRYSLSAMLNIASETDDDANTAEPRNETTTVITTTYNNSSSTCPSCHAPAGKPHASNCKGQKHE